MKKLTSLLLALALSLSLAVPALADGQSVFITYTNGEYEGTVGSKTGNGWSYDFDAATLTLSGLQNASVTLSHLGTDPTVVLAPGTKTVLTSFDSDSLSGEEGYPTVFKGSGELILSDPSATEDGVLFGFSSSVKLQDGLTMTGGTKEGDSGKLTFQAFPGQYYTLYKCMAGNKPATYVRIGPKSSAAEKPAAPSSKPAVPSSTGFSDVPDSHYAAAAIKNCVAAGIASGYSDGTFKPAASVTRAQFCVMIARAFCPDTLKQEDTAANKALGWYVPSAKALYNSGIDAGILAAVSFSEDILSAEVMNQPISRYDMAQILDNVRFCFGPGMSSVTREAAQAKIRDWSSIPKTYQDAVAACYALGIIGGQSDGTFGGRNPMNRAQACVVIDRMDKYVPIGGDSSSKPAQPSKPAETPKPAQSPEAAAAELLRLLNAERAKAGLKALPSMDSLTKAAQTRAKDLSGGYIELRADGSDWTSALEQAGVPADYVDESFVVGIGYDTPEAALKKVLETPSAKAALLNKEYTHLSVGYVHDSKGYQGYQDFWSLLYIVQSGSGSSGGSGTPSGGGTSGGDLQSMRQGVLELVNAARAQNGKSPLSLDGRLCDVAQLRADELVQSFSHTRPNGTSCFTAIQEAGISGGTMGENIAAGQGSPAAVMDSWMNSEGHRANILNGDFSSIGIGYVKAPSGYGHYWVQMFMG